jgi:hypothetical protein
MRVWRNTTDGMKDAALPENIGDLVFLYDADEPLPIKVREKLGRKPKGATYVAIDKNGPHWSSDGEYWGK